MSDASDDVRARLVDVVRRLLSGEYASGDDLDRDLDEFLDGVPDPNAANLIFYSHMEFDHEPTAEEVVDRALSYRPIQL
ncbi:hypothetical protein [Actinophytocola sp. NPDC049390]|uniref:hypothetical protein n=1 Tax=Actinophytocola sp. NPDC049390 TaxID=3363894 RepID=UPI00378926BF